jgi:hypothetical protein
MGLRRDGMGGSEAAMNTNWITPSHATYARKEKPMTPRQKMRSLIVRRGYTMAPGAYDTLTARLVEQAGFEAVY